MPEGPTLAHADLLAVTAGQPRGFAASARLRGLAAERPV